MTKSIKTEWVQFARLSSILNTASSALPQEWEHNYDNWFWDLFTEKLNVSYGDAEFTLERAELIKTTFQGMRESLCNKGEEDYDAECVAFLQEAIKVIDDGDFMYVDLES